MSDLLRSRDLVMWLTAFCLAGPVLPSCQVPSVDQTEDAATVELAWQRKRLAPMLPEPPKMPGRCAAGQLCEDPVVRLGLRIPAACKIQLDRQSLFVCWLAGAKMQEVADFYTSRGAHITVINGKVSPAQLQIRPTSPDPLHPDRQPLLIVQHTPEGVRLTGTAASEVRDQP